MSVTGVRWIFFDVGWTLVDEVQAHIFRLENARKACPEPERWTTDGLFALYTEAIVRFDRDPFVTVLETIGIAGERRPEFPYGKMDEVPYSDAEPALRELSGKYRLGVLANQSEGLKGRMEKWGLARHLELFLGSKDVGLSKPDPRIFEMAASQSKAEPGELVMVGDRVDNDVAPAKAAGWKTVRLLRGLHAKQTPRAGGEMADVEVGTLTKIAGWLEGIVRRENR